MWFVYKSIFAERRYMSYSTRKRTSDDIIVKEFWRNNERFADLFNAVLFKGKCVIKAENLQEIDTDVSGTIRVQEYKETLKRARDVVKKYYNGVEFNILGLEMQEKVHLAMPLRTMVYDALGYIKEYNDSRAITLRIVLRKSVKLTLMIKIRRIIKLILNIRAIIKQKVIEPVKTEIVAYRKEDLKADARADLKESAKA